MSHSMRVRMSSAALLVVAVLLTSAADAQAPEMSKAVAARVKRDAALCKTRAILDACNDALRRTPSDPALLTAHGDALLRAGRTADALKQYHRAAAVAPSQKGLSAKIATAEKRARLKPSLVRAKPRPAAPPADASRVANAAVPSSKSDHFSNAAPETQSH